MQTAINANGGRLKSYFEYWNYLDLIFNYGDASTLPMLIESVSEFPSYSWYVMCLGINVVQGDLESLPWKNFIDEVGHTIPQDFLDNPKGKCQEYGFSGDSYQEAP